MQPETSRPAENSGKMPEILGREMSVAQVVAAVEKDEIFYDDSGGGVTFSGGEPLMQPQFLFDLLDACRRLEIHTLLDTSGYAPADIFRTALDKVDGILFDLKLMDATAHRKYTGISNRMILDNFKTAVKSGNVQVRVPIVPGITDGEDNIDRIAGLVQSTGTVNRIDLLPYHRTAAAKYKRLGLENRMGNSRPPSPALVDAVKERFLDHGLTVHVGG